MEMKMQTSVAYGQSKESGIYALASVVNALAAEGVTNPVVQVKILIPMYAYKSRMHTMEKVMKKTCAEQGICLQEVKSERSNIIGQSMVIVTGSGCAEDAGENAHHFTKGQDIVLTEYIGMEGMLRITEEKEEELKTRFSTGFIRQILSYKPHVFADWEIKYAKANGADRIYSVGEGGIFAALWNLSKETGKGLEVDLKKIPVLQETIEVCEFFHLNPYQLTSAGVMLMVVSDGENFAEQLREQNIPATFIGKLTDNNDKILKNGEEIRYIDRPAPDELMKIFEE